MTYEELQSRLEYLKNLEHGWDGGSAPPIPRDAFDFYKEIIEKLRSVCQGLEVFPTYEGELSVEWDMISEYYQSSDLGKPYRYCVVFRNDKKTVEFCVTGNVDNFSCKMKFENKSITFYKVFNIVQYFDRLLGMLKD